MKKVLSSVWFALVFSAACVYLQWQLGISFGAYASGIVGLAAITTISLLLGWRYAQRERKGWIHTLVIVSNLIYLSVTTWRSWGLTPDQIAGRNAEEVQLRQVYENKKSAERQAAIISTDRSAELQRRRSHKPERVTVVRSTGPHDLIDKQGQPLQYRDGSSNMVTYQLTPGTEIFYWLFDAVTHKEEEYIKIKVVADQVVGYYRFSELDNAIVAQERGGSKLAAPSVIAAASPVLPAGAAVTAAPPTAPPFAVGPVYQMVQATAVTWTKTEVIVRPDETVYYGPFPSGAEGERVEVCVGGGPPLTLRPYLWSDGKFGGHVTWKGVSQVPWKAWIRLTHGDPMMVTLSKRQPY